MLRARSGWWCGVQQGKVDTRPSPQPSSQRNTPSKVDRREKKKFYSKEISREKEGKEDQEKRKTLKKLKPAVKLKYECGRIQVQLPAIKKS